MSYVVESSSMSRASCQFFDMLMLLVSVENQVVMIANTVSGITL